MTLIEARERFPPIWTIYSEPADFPGYIVVRCWYGEVQEPDAAGFRGEDALARARLYVQQLGACFPVARRPEDEPQIVESWL